MAVSPNGRVVLIILLVTSVLFFIAFVITLFVYFYQLSNLISVSDCPAAVNNYGVLPATTGTPLNSCNGATCTFTANTLQDAVNQCNSQPAVCSQFVWEPGTVTFVSNPVGSSDLNMNLYIRPTATI